jgi:zinc transporter ZupT
LIQNVVFATLSAIGAAVALATLIYSHVVTYHIDADQRDTLLTFTCGLYNNAKSFTSSGSKIDLPLSTSTILPEGFKRLCIENQVSRWMMIVLFVLEVLCVLVAAIGLVGERRIGKVRKSRIAELQDAKWSLN